MEFVHDTLGQRVVLGSGILEEAVAAEVRRLGEGPVMLIAGEYEATLGDRVAAGLEAAGLRVALRWGAVRQHVPMDLARRARVAAAEAGTGIVVSVGGGSTTGLAKAVAMEQDVQIIAVPTTFAGSEATNVWGLTQDGVKTTGSDPRVLPATVVYDAELTTTLPPELAVASGLNALAHCVDSLWAPRADPINLVVALEGARALAEGLPRVHADVQDLTGHEQCLYGAYLSAVSFASAGSGMHHKICHVLGGAYDLPHAPTHAVVLPYVLAHNSPGAPALVGRLATSLGAPGSAVEADPVAAATTAMEGLRTRLEAPRSLADVGLAEGDLPEATRLCLDKIPSSNPVPVTESSLAALLRAAWIGDPITSTTSPSPPPATDEGVDR